MLEFHARFEGIQAGAPYGRLSLPFYLRQKSRLRATLESGEEVSIVLARGECLRGGDRLAGAQGEVIEVVAADEPLVHAACETPQALARVAYHLGNRHVPIQVGEGWVRFGADHVLEEMVRGLGAAIASIDAPFEPEAGAYAAHHRHDESGHGGRIHEFGEHSHR